MGLHRPGSAGLKARGAAATGIPYPCPALTPSVQTTPKLSQPLDCTAQTSSLRENTSKSLPNPWRRAKQSSRSRAHISAQRVFSISRRMLSPASPSRLRVQQWSLARDWQEVRLGSCCPPVQSGRSGGNGLTALRASPAAGKAIADVTGEWLRGSRSPGSEHGALGRARSLLPSAPFGRGERPGSRRCSVQRHSFGFIAFYCCSWLILPALCHLEEGGRAGWHVAALCRAAQRPGTCLGCCWVCTTAENTSNGGKLGPAPCWDSPQCYPHTAPLLQHDISPPLVTCLVVYKTLKLMV